MRKNAQWPASACPLRELFAGLRSLSIRIADSWLASSPRTKNNRPVTMASMAPTLTPRPSKMIGIPQPSPARMHTAEIGRKTRSDEMVS